MKRRLAPFTDAGLRFRLLEEADLPMTLAWRNKPRVRGWFLHSDALTMATHTAWFEGYRERDDDFVFIVEGPSPLDRPIGQAALYGVQWKAGRAEVGRLMIGEDEAVGRGFGASMVRALSRLAFGELGLGELFARVKAGNEPSLRAFRAAGYEVENPCDDVLRLVRRLS